MMFNHARVWSGGALYMIQKNQSDTSRFMHTVLFPSAARVGFRHLLEHIAVNEDRAILLPSYIGYSAREGSGVHDPIEQCSVAYDFYRVDSRLSADLDDIENKLMSNRYFAVFVIHYFGIVQSDISSISRLCKKFDVFLIEDCAHTLYTTHCDIEVGRWGDFALYSVHKLLPTCDGGILRINRKDIELPTLPESARMNWDSLELYAKADLMKIGETRLQNYHYLLKAIRRIEGMTVLYPDLPSGNIPMNFPILVNGKTRHEVYVGLQRENVQSTALYYKLINKISEKKYPVSHEISKHILNLPIHQDIGYDGICYIANALRRVLAGG